MGEQLHNALLSFIFQMTASCYWFTASHWIESKEFWAYIFAWSVILHLYSLLSVLKFLCISICKFLTSSYLATNILNILWGICHVMPSVMKSANAHSPCWVSSTLNNLATFSLRLKELMEGWLSQSEPLSSLSLLLCFTDTKTLVLNIYCSP